MYALLPLSAMCDLLWFTGYSSVQCRYCKDSSAFNLVNHSPAYFPTIRAPTASDRKQENLKQIKSQANKNFMY